jgi:hypothetical protein
MSDKEPQSQAEFTPQESDESARERALKATAHNPSISHEARVRAAEQLADMQAERTGKEIDPEHEASIGDYRAEQRAKQQEQSQ